MTRTLVLLICARSRPASEAEQRTSALHRADKTAVAHRGTSGPRRGKEPAVKQGSRLKRTPSLAPKDSAGLTTQTRRPDATHPAHCPTRLEPGSILFPAEHT